MTTPPITLRTCPAGCGRGVTTGHLMCGACWRQVPAHLQHEVWRTCKAYRRDSSDQRFMEYSAAREAALGAVG